MIKTVFCNGHQLEVDLADLKKDFEKMYTGRFSVDYIAVASDRAYFPGSDSIITGKCTPLTDEVHLEGTGIYLISKECKCFFNLHPNRFETIRDMILVENMQERKNETE